MARTKQAPEDDDLPTDESAQAVQDEPAVETTTDSGMDAPPEQVVSKPLYEELGLEDTYKDISDAKELARKLKEDRDSRVSEYERRMVEDRQRLAAQFTQTPEWQQYQRWREEAARPKPPEEEKQWFVKPEWDDAWAKYIKPNAETGEAEIVGAPQGIAEKIENYANWKAKHQHRLTNDFGGYIQEALAHELPKIMRQNFGQMMAEQRDAERLNQLEAESARWLYQHEGDTPIRGWNGELVISDLGMQVVNLARQLHGSGQGDRATCFELARDAVYGRSAMAIKAQELMALETNSKTDKRKLDTLDANAKRRPSRSGSAARPETQDAPTSGRTSYDVFARAFDEGGFSDETFRHSIG